MVFLAPWIGPFLGVGLSGAFLWYEVGLYATPQVPVTMFDERKEAFSYIAGLFVGVALSFPFLLMVTGLVNGALIGALSALLILLAGTEIAQWLLLRSVYFGSGYAGPFYALGLRAGIGAILVLSLTSQTLGYFGINPISLGLAVAQGLSLVALQVAGALLSMPAAPGSGRIGGGPLPGVFVGGLGFFLIGLSTVLGGGVGIFAALVAALGAATVYRRLRLPVLSRAKPPSAPPASTERSASSYGRTDR